MVMKKNSLKKCVGAILIVMAASATSAQSASLKDSLEHYVKTRNADIGISVCVIETGEQISVNAKKHYPMQSVYKFPQALAVLDAVDKQQISLTQKVHVTKSELRPDTWSPLREKYPEGNMDITVAELLEYSVSKSDNNACDILFKLLGGTAPVQKYLKKSGIKGMQIISTEEEMAKDWKLQYKNYASPEAMTALLKGFYNKRYLSPESTDFLMRLMTESSNSVNRIKALLPKDAVVAHKTGTSSTNKDGLRPALNDVGIITLPDGNHLALTVFVSDATEKYEDGEKAIAEIAKLVWDYYSKN